MSIFEVRHQGRAVRVIQRALGCGRLPHAYLFSGPDGVGKEMLAERLARVLTCERPVELDQAPIPELEDFSGRLQDACGECKDCRLAAAGTHPDIHLIHRELHKMHPDSTVRNRKGLELTVDVIRHFLIDAVGVKPSRGRSKVFIVREADKITAAAQNAMLKTLEEPPATTFVILLASNLNNMLPTTRSRCQQVPFAALPVDFVAAKLAELLGDIDPATARYSAAFSGGSLGQARRCAEDGIDQHNREVLGTLGRLSAGDVLGVAKKWQETAKTLGEQVARRDSEITETEAQRRGLRLIMAMLSTWFDDQLRVSAGTSEQIANIDQRAQLEAGSAVCGLDRAGQAIQAIGNSERQLDQNAAVPLVVESLAVKLGRLIRG